MSSPGSCFRCSKAQALLSPSGLCEDCAATDVTADPTPPEPPAPELDPAGATVTDVPRVPPAEGPTATPPGSATGSAPADGFPVLPESPPGFELLRHLGGGGMGDVYLAREWPAGRDVALKFLKRPESPAASQRFVTELRVLAELDHPNIVGVLASDFQRATPYFTMARAAGGSLADALQAGLPAPDEAVRIIRVIAGAVAAAHAKGIIHRDLKPSNVLLFGAPGEWHQLKVADFGLAKRLGDEDGFTATEDMMGTPGYMPPEQVSRANGEDGKIDRRADVYGLGATLYHLLTGRAPFVGATKLGIVNQVLADAPERPRALRPEIPLALEAIALKCLAKDPVERYQSVAAFLGALDDYERLGRDPGATELTRRRRVRLWAARNRRRIGAAAAVVLVVAGAFALGAAWWPGRGAAEARVPDPVAAIPDEVRTPDGRVLPFRVRLGHDKSKVTAADDGTVTVSSWGLCLVEYTPAGPRPERYHLRAAVRHEASDIGGRVGVFFTHHAVPGKFGDTHRFGQLTYNDIRLSGDAAVMAPPIPVPDTNHVRVGALVRGVGPERPWTGQMELAAGAPFKPVGRRGDRWRTVDIRIAPDGVGGTWDAQDVGLAAAARFEAVFTEKLAAGPPAAARFDPKAGFGLVVENSSASFRAVELIPDKND